ncbi:hypothetical protein [Legionella spiritensis]|uniref:hypothetical protein n=1 Tax=Legionella spiritensis TaxID=452 RepID=UPI000F703257|nr:hypothetical protein [Legionella spiritensis]VEG91104.1 Uncharacterised protein [Legionella spiritensis]
MLILAIILFIVVAGLGAVIIIPVLKNKFPPRRLVYVHGATAAVAIFIIILYMLKEQAQPLLVVCLLLFILTACLGLLIYKMDIKRRESLKIVVILHPLLAVISLIAFVTYLLAQYLVPEQPSQELSWLDSPAIEVTQQQTIWMESHES